MAQYGVGTANPYDLLDEDAPVKPQEKPQPAKEVAPAPKASTQADAPKRGAFSRGRGRGGRGRGGRGNGNREPRRFYDRHSGTGRGKEVRKGGYGGYAAEGTFQDDLKAEEVAKQLTLEDKPVAAEGAAPAAAPAAPAEVKAPETEEEKKAREEAEKEAAREASLLSYDQFIEQQKKKVVEEDAKIETRKVEIDEKKFKACKALAKSEDDGYGDILGSTELDGEGKKKDKKAKKTKHLDEVLKELPGAPAAAPRAFAPRAFAPEGDFHGGRGGFRGGRGGRGGFPRGGPRGGFGGRGGRGGAAPMKPVDVKSDADFPKLGGK